MAEMRRRTLLLSSGKEVKLFGNSIAIGKGLQLGEGYTANIFTCVERELLGEGKKAGRDKNLGQLSFNDSSLSEEEKLKELNNVGQSSRENKKKPSPKTEWIVLNPHNLSMHDLIELADYNIRLWMDFKDNIRKHAIDDPRIFNRDGLL